MLNKLMLFVVLFASAVFLVTIPGTCLAASGDDTEINKRDRLEKQLTADQQGETKEDREITQKIRRAIIKDKSLSTYAHNVKIITVGGKVSLKGPVKSEKEKMAIEKKAAQIVGIGKITSEIDIVP